jgi:hypothetical protein
VRFLRDKYGESLSRKDIDIIDPSLLGEIDKEALRKLKISFANKGRKPWNVGRQHRPDTVQRIKEKTRQAMCRFDVRKRWEAGWKPKSHTEKTKEKLRVIMKQRQKEKTACMTKWLNKEMGIDLNDYMCLPPRFRYAYKRLFNLKWRTYKAMSSEKKSELKEALHEAYAQILKIHAHEAKRRKSLKEKRRKKINHKNKILILKKKKHQWSESKQPNCKTKEQCRKTERTCRCELLSLETIVANSCNGAFRNIR